MELFRFQKVFECSALQFSSYSAKILQLVGKFTSLFLNDAFSFAWIINWTFRTMVCKSNLIKPTEHQQKAVMVSRY